MVSKTLDEGYLHVKIDKLKNTLSSNDKNY